MLYRVVLAMVGRVVDEPYAHMVFLRHPHEPAQELRPVAPLIGSVVQIDGKRRDPIRFPRTFPEIPLQPGIDTVRYEVRGFLGSSEAKAEVSRFRVRDPVWDQPVAYPGIVIIRHLRLPLP